MSAYYNEIDPFAAAWLRELITAGLIADGEVDERSIADVTADDVRGFRQCHFFAGIGGWSYALRLAGWPDDRPVWTGSCPCGPWSLAGKANGPDDPRDLWPTWFQLWRQSRPGVVFGEQVESPAGRSWLDRVCADVESLGYAFGPFGLPAACVGTPQGRPRFWFVADADGARWEGRERQGQSDQAWESRTVARREPLRPDHRPWPPGSALVHDIPVLADGVSGRMGGCKGYGNAIVPQVAAEFIGAYLDIESVEARDAGRSGVARASDAVRERGDQAV